MKDLLFLLFYHIVFALFFKAEKTNNDCKIVLRWNPKSKQT